MENTKENTTAEVKNAVDKTSAKKSVKVINAPHKKKKLRTPTHFLRLGIIWSFVICLFLLTFPFLELNVYITDDLKTTFYREDAYLTLSSQEQIDTAADELQKAIDGLTVDKNAEEQPVMSARALSTVNYNWSYYTAKGVDGTRLQKLISQAMDIDTSKYTEKSVKALNTATISAQKMLCANVKLSQTGLQMLFGTVSEAYGYDSSASSVTHSLFAFALALIPTVCFFAACFDKHRHIKHIICFVGALLCLSDIFFTIYPNVGIGAVLSIIMYFIICILNVASIYAKQQEDYIVKHPEKEAEFSEKHPQFVKALINDKSFGTREEPDKKELELKAAKNAQKRRKKKR